MTVPPTGRDRLYELLPAVHRIADAGEGEALRALLALINEQADNIRDDIRQMWDDFFIETAQHWVIPYLGDLVGNIPLHDLDVRAAAETAERLFADLPGPDLAVDNPIRLRADVAKTIYYRRRKGTPAMLEQLARDVTGWDVRLVEFFQLLDWIQHLEHVRLDCHGCPDLRSIERNDRIGGPWDEATHTVDVRAINEWDGWYGIKNVGFFLWRLRALPRARVDSRPIGNPATTWRYTFSPLGRNVPLYSAGRFEETAAGRSTELSVADAIRPAAFFEDLTAAHAPAPPTPPPSAYYGPEAAAGLVIEVEPTGGGPLLPVPTSDIVCANLDAWTTVGQPPGTQICIDPSRGRIGMPAGRPNQHPVVTFCEGFATEMAGGEYSRANWTPAPDVVVTGGKATLDTAIAGRLPTQRTFQVDDSRTYTLGSDITLKPGEALTIQARNGVRPHLRLTGTAASIAVKGQDDQGRLTLNGVLVEGGLRIESSLEAVRIMHSTLVPGRSVEQEASSPPTGPSLVVAGGTTANPLNTGLEVQIAFSIVGALEIPAHVTRLTVLDSIVDGLAGSGGGVQDKAGTSGPPAHLERSTILGTSRFFELDLASESIFTGVVTVDRRQAGCVRFSYVPPKSATPQRYRCQPGLELGVEIEQTLLAHPGGAGLPANWKKILESEIDAWLVPSFEALELGDPGYGRLRRTCPVQIQTGAEDGSEMGVFCLLKQPQRLANLRLRLDEYLPIGLAAGLIPVT